MINTSAFPAVAVALWTLGAFSVATWGLIFFKAAQHLRVARANARFAAKFWDANTLQAASDLARGAGGKQGQNGSALGRIAAAGFTVLANNSAGGSHDDHEFEHNWDRHEQLQRNLGQQLKRERRNLDSGLAVLASVGATAPFVGLFGTVWGIMNAMHDIGKNGNASIDVVAGPIGEALIATGIGIAVAIPAVLAYNFFLRRVKSAVADYEDFANDFLNLAQRASYRVEHARAPLEEARPIAREHRHERARDRDNVPSVIVGGKSA
jgi:biopolymer transport protein ExbB